ncbi:hypothetical protein DIURU_002215 [Diutina rugosa]|uniref:Thymidylate kinase n=1 Tax=Diutina rugosa TaxID=5481 RepID=A0A642UXC1_DIURU|nr:uncharacterized protein DIURU_002215 [Diutina rugosa]KAA8903704.1 hypothetical protein DIURU_002215 [Diutina rugosa]
MRGSLILIEGLDRAGKSTQCERLSQRLQGDIIKFPDRSTPVGQLLDRYLTDASFNLPDETVHLLFSANRWEVVAQLEDKLLKGKHIIMDRYIYSGIAYSLAKRTTPRISNSQWLYAPDRGLPKPDITLFLTLDLEEQANRKGWGDERYEKAPFQAKVKENFDQLFSANSIIDNGVVEVIDVNHKSIDEVTDAIWNKVTTNGADKPTDAPISRFALQ